MSDRPKTKSRAVRVTLRDILPEDLPVFFAHHQDPAATWMAAFTMADPSDRAAFDSHWEKILAHDHITKRTILLDGKVVGNIMCYQLLGAPNIAYWIWREKWGNGIATAALRLFLDVVSERPLVGRIASDNVASGRVLEKCGFVRIGEERGFAHARGENVDEIVFRLD